MRPHPKSSAILVLTLALLLAAIPSQRLLAAAPPNDHFENAANLVSVAPTVQKAAGEPGTENNSFASTL